MGTLEELSGPDDNLLALQDMAKLTQSFASELTQISSLPEITEWMSIFASRLNIRRGIYLYMPPEGSFDRDKISIMSIGKVTDKIVFDIMGGLDLLRQQDFDINYFRIRTFENYEPFFRFDPTLKKRGFYEKDGNENFVNYAAFPGMIYPVYSGRFMHGYFGVVSWTDSTNTVQARLLQSLFQMVHQRFTELYLTNHGETIELSDRELQVLNEIRLGNSNSKIAERLNISPHTVDTYIRRVYKKLDVSDRTSASYKATVLGLLG